MLATTLPIPSARIDQPLLDQKFYQPSEDRAGKNRRDNGKHTFYLHKKLLAYN